MDVVLNFYVPETMFAHHNGSAFYRNKMKPFYWVRIEVTVTVTIGFIYFGTERNRKV